MKDCALPCPHKENCCSYPMVRSSYKEQLKIKERRVLEAFKKEGFSNDEIRKVLKPTRSAPLTKGYRNKAKWILEQGPKGLKMGMYKRGTHDVVDISQCMVHAPLINEVSNFIKQKLEERHVPCGSKNLTKGTLRYLIVRYSFREKKLLTVFVTTVGKVPGLDQVFFDLDQKFGEKVVSIVQNINADAGDVLLGEANRFFKKKAELTETLGQYRVPVGPLSFLQVNSAQASYLYQRVRKLLGGGPYGTGLDLYSGVGLMAMHMSGTTKRILAVEEMGSAALEAITATRRNKVNNILQLCGDSLEGISTFFNEWGTPEWVIVNPPRKGCDERVLEALMSRPPGKMVYVSCSPTTLARDLRFVREQCPDLEIKTLEPVDMFPQTEHVECIALLENKSFKKSSARVSTPNPRGSSSKKALH